MKFRAYNVEGSAAEIIYTKKGQDCWFFIFDCWIYWLLVGLLACFVWVCRFDIELVVI